MSRRSAEVVVVGAGIVGVATAHHLAARLGVADVMLIDPRPPLTLTSDKSTECYRNWWPNAPMVALMNRSIDLLERLSSESGDRFALNRRGYLYVTGEAERLVEMEAEAADASRRGAGPLRIHRGAADDPAYVPSPASGFEGVPDGADLVVSPDLLHRLFPWLTPHAVGALHVRRAGWLSAQQLGALLLERARTAGTGVVRDRVVGVDVAGGRVAGVRLAGGERVAAGAVVDAAGPMLAEVAEMAGSRLPVHAELHGKVAFPDPLGAVPRHAPLAIWDDPQRLSWSDEERRELGRAGRDELMGRLPAGCHGRPEGGADSPWVLALWEYRRIVTRPVWPLPHDPLSAEVVVRGMATMVPALAGYLERFPRTVVDGGYYMKTEDNRPLIGPLDAGGAFVCGAVSGYGVMAALAAGELAALHVTGAPLPAHAADFHPARLDDPAYLATIGPDVGQI